MCQNTSCPCRADKHDLLDLFLIIWDANYTIEEEKAIDADPEITALADKLPRRNGPRW